MRYAFPPYARYGARRAIDASDFENRLRELEESQAASREDTAALRHNWAARFDASVRRD